MFVGIGVGVGRQRFAGGFADSYSSRVLADGGTIEALSCVANASTLLQQASLLFIPSGYKAGVAYSALPNNGNGDLTWSRNSTAYRTQSNGNIGSVGANVPRLSYMYGSCPSALLEPQRTNLFLQSNDFSLSTWFKVGTVTITANAFTSPEGIANASRLETSGTSSIAQLSISVTSGLSYTVSFYVKANSVSNNTFRLYGDSTQTSSDFTATSNWQRFQHTVTASSTGPKGFGLTRPSSGANMDIQIFGAQVEAGAYPTTYIPTTTTSATRIADTFTRNNIYTNGLISASGGTWFVELKNNVAYVRDGAGGFGIGDTNTLGSNSLFLRLDQLSSARLSVMKRVSGSVAALYTTPTDNVKLAIKWNGSTADIFANGVKVVSATTFTSTIMEFFVVIGSAVGVPVFIQTMALYNTPLSDANCITLTT